MLHRRVVFLAATLLFGLASATLAEASTATLAWNAPSDQTVTGYVISYGVSSGVYTQQINVGNVLQYSVTGLSSTKPYYLVVQSYNAAGTRSAYSGEVVFQAPAAVMTSATVSSNKVSPQSTSTSIVFTGGGAGGVTPYSYEFLVSSDNWTTYSVARSWSTAATFTWNPMKPGIYQVGIWARSAGDTANAPEQAAAVGFAIGAQLTIQVQGSGAVTSGDHAIQCSAGACTHVYAPGSAVTLQAAPSANNAFAGWSPIGCSSGAVVMNDDQTCTAIFLTQSAGAPRRGIVSLNASGLGDVFTYNPLTGAHASHYSDGALHFAETTGTWAGQWKVYPADFDGDGITDFFLYQPTSGQWYKAINDGVGNFSYISGQWSAGWDVYIVDLNGDHRSDVFISDPKTGVWYRCVTTGTGLGGFALTQGSWPVGLEIYPTDLNGDGFNDFFVYNPGTGQWSQAINDGSNGFTYKSGNWPTGLTITSGDFNGDGRGDFFVYNPESGIWSVATTLVSTNFAYQSGIWSPGWTLTAADFDGDGKDDLFLYNPSLGWWYEAISDGSADVFSFSFGTWSAGWQIQATDFNNDGKADLLLYNPNTGQWYQAVNTGAGTFNYATGVWEPGLTVLATTPKIP